MGTAVMHSQDCLTPYQKSNARQAFIDVVYHHGARSSLQPHSQSRRKAGHGGSSQKAKSKGAEVQKRPFKSNEVWSETGKKFVKNQNQNSQGKIHRNNGRREQFEPVAKNLVTGQVTILKRGQAIESSSHMMEASPPKIRATPDPALRNACVEAEPTGFEIETCGGGATKKCGSYPSLKFEEEWAGPAFANSVSPSPRCLPVPMFFMKRASQENVRCEEEETIDTLATKGLRRLLGLD